MCSYFTSPSQKGILISSFFGWKVENLDKSNAHYWIIIATPNKPYAGKLWSERVKRGML